MKLSPVPLGFRTVTAYLGVNGGLKALEFYEKAFGAKEVRSMRQQTPDGKIIHARFKIGDTLLMLSDHFGPPEPKNEVSALVTLHIYTRNVDKLWKRALAAGAKVAMPLDNQYWGERYGQLVDPFGHKWSVSMRVNMSKEEIEAKRRSAMAMFASDKSA